MDITSFDDMFAIQNGTLVNKLISEIYSYSYRYNISFSELYIPNEVKRYQMNSFLGVKCKVLNVPYHNSLELAFEKLKYFRADVVVLRLEDGCNIKFAPKFMSQLDCEIFDIVLKLLRTESVGIKASKYIKIPIAVYLAKQKKNNEAILYLKSQASEVGKYLIDIDDKTAMDNYFGLGIAGKRTAVTLYNYAANLGATEFQVMIFKYLNEHFDNTKPKDRFRL